MAGPTMNEKVIAAVSLESSEERSFAVVCSLTIAVDIVMVCQERRKKKRKTGAGDRDQRIGRDGGQNRQMARNRPSERGQVTGQVRGGGGEEGQEGTHFMHSSRRMTILVNPRVTTMGGGGVLINA